MAPVPARLAVLLTLLALSSLVAACSSGAPSGGAQTTVTTARPAPATSPPATTAPTTAPTPTTTVYAPAAPQATPDAAAGALINAWATGNPAEAASVAAPAARQALLQSPYPGQIDARGCTDPDTSPGTCTYADLSTGTLYEIGVTHLPNGWYVSTVTVES